MPDKEFKITIIRMLAQLNESTDKTTKQNQENDAWTKWQYQYQQTIIMKKSQREILKLKNNSNWIENFTGGTQQSIWPGRRISQFNHRTFKITEAEESPCPLPHPTHPKKREKKKMRDWGITNKENKICIMGVLESEKGEKGAENLFEETVAITFSNLRREMNIQIQ